MKLDSDHKSNKETKGGAPTCQRKVSMSSTSHHKVNPLWHNLATNVQQPASGGLPVIQQLCNDCEQQENGSIVDAVQTKLTVGSPNDPYEQEADGVANKVMRMPETLAEETETIQAKRASPSLIQRMEIDDEADESDSIQSKAKNNGHVHSMSNVQKTIASGSGGLPVPEPVRHRVEPVLGADLSNVNVHNDGASHRAAADINARAFTHKNDIYLGQGQSPGDVALMAHEATHVVQQSSDPSLQRLQRASLISDSERFVFSNPGEGSYFTFADLVSGVRRRYQLDGYASYKLARWLDTRHGIFRNGNRRYDREFTVPMPRMVAMFKVDWVEPFSAYGGQYGISADAFNKAQDIWAQQNIFIGFRRGGPVGGAGFRQIDFNPAAQPDGTRNRNTAEEINLLALRSSAGMPAGYFHIVVTGTTTEDPTATGKSIRSSREQPVAAGSEGILLFAGAYQSLGYQQVVPRGDSGLEIAELLAHEIGHFLFHLSHNRPPEVTNAGVTIRSKTDIMRGGGAMDPNDSFGETSRQEIDEAFESGGIARPESATSR
ncbi:MAG: DUF4157 domain-containing protein [Gammaproteobacteria bacterium]|nr:DUF4157 domain-containing protein [Gammaproteobacteria bacterium]